MAIRTKRVIERFLLGDRRHASTGRGQPACVTLPPAPGVAPSNKPPVRIFLGTEAFQFRAERVFIWSVERVRDPSRTYEIHLMKDFAGFERRLWLTGFTNYRFAIPELAGGRGRAIYNDVDQIYLRDPAEMFDLPMGEAGVLSINDRDTSVMLIDCERMVSLWNGRTARKQGNRELEQCMRSAGLWGHLDAGWNARDAEYAPDRSMCVHYTTIHSQPWRPTPMDYVYRQNPAESIWSQIEQEADEAGFNVFSAEHPSPDFGVRLPSRDTAVPEHDWQQAFHKLLTDAGATSVAYYGVHEKAGAALSEEGLIHRGTPESLAGSSTAPLADVVLADGLARLPGADIAWVLDTLFARARKAVMVAITLDTAATRRTPAVANWWYQQMVAAGRRALGRHWRLAVREPKRIGCPGVSRWSGGALLTSQPNVWALMHYKTGHRSQVQGMVNALGWQVTPREITRDVLRYSVAMTRDRLGLAAESWPDGIQPPWPDVVVASGWLPSLAARAISQRSGAASRLILMGRRGARVGETQDIAVACRHFRLPPNPRQLETILPPSKVNQSLLEEQHRQWPALLEGRPSPRIVWLVGGDSEQYALDENTAASLAQRIQSQTNAAHGSLAVLTSRRTRAVSEAAIRDELAAASQLIPWQATNAQKNPYTGYLAAADILVVTGESESMLAEAVATGKPVYIAALPAARPGLRRRAADWVVAQAGCDRFNARGSRRPQEGLQYLCARLMDHRVLLPRRDMPALHEQLVEHGVARMLEDQLAVWRPEPWHEAEHIADRIRRMLGLVGTDGGEQQPS